MAPNLAQELRDTAAIELDGQHGHCASAASSDLRKLEDRSA